ncbi:MAG: hypothetical protein RLZZ546_1094 [Bacteroidota bacterium]
MRVAISFFIFFASMSLFSQNDTMKVEGNEFIFIDKKANKTYRLEFSSKDFKRLAASFDDPSRILMHYPGFSSVNDQANGLSYHGLSPHLFDWQLNDVEIVNPNHLSNAGTLSDLASPSSGGVNMFSGNVIENYQFKSNFDLDRQGTSLGGTSNINVDGVDHSYIQASLLGLETGIKVFNNDKRHLSFNYRYSFTGLLDNLGVKFGNESIKFQDLMVRAKLFSNEKNKISGIFFTGNSSNYHQKLDSAFITVKDHLDIDYKSKIIIGQLAHQYVFGKESFIKSTISFSTKEDTRTSNGVYNSFIFNDRFQSKEYLHAFHQFLSFNKRFKAGYKILYNFKDLSNIRSTNISERYEGDALDVLTYANYEVPINSNFSGQINLLSGMKKSKILYPSLKLSYNYHAFSAHVYAGRSFQSLLKFFSDNTTNSNNFLAEFIYNKNSSKSSIKMFYHNISNVPYSFTYINMLNNPPLFEAINFFNGTAYIKGIEVEHQFDLNNFWCNINATFFEAKFTNTDLTATSNLENNFRKIFNFNIGKRFLINKNQLATSLSFHNRGGQYAYFVSKDIYHVSPDYLRPLDDRLSDYSRLDLRINYSFKKSFWSLDIQNVLNKENEAYKSYSVNGEIVNKQLGLIPVLTYKRWL